LFSSTQILKLTQAAKTSVDLASKFEKSFHNEKTLLNEFKMKLDEIKDAADDFSQEKAQKVLLNIQINFPSTKIKAF